MNTNNWNLQETQIVIFQRHSVTGHNESLIYITQILYELTMSTKINVLHHCKMETQHYRSQTKAGPTAIPVKFGLWNSKHTCLVVLIQFLLICERVTRSVLVGR